MSDTPKRQQRLAEYQKDKKISNVYLSPELHEKYAEKSRETNMTISAMLSLLVEREYPELLKKLDEREQELALLRDLDSDPDIVQKLKEENAQLKQSLAEQTLDIEELSQLKQEKHRLEVSYAEKKTQYLALIQEKDDLENTYNEHLALHSKCVPLPKHQDSLDKLEQEKNNLIDLYERAIEQVAKEASGISKARSVGTFYTYHSITYFKELAQMIIQNKNQ